MVVFVAPLVVLVISAMGVGLAHGGKSAHAQVEEKPIQSIERVVSVDVHQTNTVPFDGAQQVKGGEKEVDKQDQKNKDEQEIMRDALDRREP